MEIFHGIIPFILSSAGLESIMNVKFKVVVFYLVLYGNVVKIGYFCGKTDSVS